MQRLERTVGEAGSGHHSLTCSLASSVFHGCTRTELPRALLRSLWLAGRGESQSVLEQAGRGNPKVGGRKNITALTPRGSSVPAAPGGRAKARVLEARGYLPSRPPAARSLVTWPKRLLEASGKSAKARNSCQPTPLLQSAPLLCLALRLYSCSPHPKVKKSREMEKLSWLFCHHAEPPLHPPLLWLSKVWGLKGTAHLLRTLLF